MTVALTENRSTLPEGYTLRPAAMADLPACVALFNTYSRMMYGLEEFSESDLRTEWTSPGLSIEESFRVVVSPQNEIVGYIEVWDTHSVPVHPWVWWRVHPDLDVERIGTVLLAWADERCHQAIAKCPPEARVAYRCGSKTGYTPAENAMKNLGMQHIRYSWTMQIVFDTAPLPTSMPDGFSIRSYQHPADLENVYQTVNDSFRDHFGFVEESLEAGLERWQHWVEGDEKFDPSLWFMAIHETSGEVAAVSLCAPEALNDPLMGWVNVLGVRRPYRKNGLGLALLQHSFHELHQRGKNKVALGVDASNLTGATRLYEKAGMHVYREMALYEKEIRPGVELSTTQVNE